MRRADAGGHRRPHAPPTWRTPVPACAARRDRHPDAPRRVETPAPGCGSGRHRYAERRRRRAAAAPRRPRAPSRWPVAHDEPPRPAAAPTTTTTRRPASARRGTPTTSRRGVARARVPRYDGARSAPGPARPGRGRRRRRLGRHSRSEFVDLGGRRHRTSRRDADPGRHGVPAWPAGPTQQEPVRPRRAGGPAAAGRVGRTTTRLTTSTGRSCEGKRIEHGAGSTGHLDRHPADHRGLRRVRPARPGRAPGGARRVRGAVRPVS